MEGAAMAELKPRGQLGKIDFSNPRMQPMIRMLQDNIRKETMRWQPEAGIILRRVDLSITDMPFFSCMILEPEHMPNERNACLFCHGGGMIFPLQVSSLKIAEYLARAAQISVWVPDYHLPPCAPFPNPMQECMCAWLRMSQAADKAILYGESVGGALAASLALYLRDHQERQPERLMLIDPVTDCETEKYPSASLDAQAVWTVKNNRYMWNQYLPDETTTRMPYAVPIREAVDGLPPTYLETAEIDILRDEGEAFGKKLQAAGIPTEIYRIACAWHGFDTEIDHPYVQQVLHTRAEYLKKAIK